MTDTGSSSPANPPRVSVLMPVFNSARYLNEALTSVSRQTYRDFELVVLDDGSSDGSPRMLRSYLALEPRMRLITRENRGLIFTRNQLLKEARGELVAWMDSDDIAAPERLALQVWRFDDKADLVCLGSAIENIDTDGSPLDLMHFPPDHESVVEQQAKGGGMRFPTLMMRTQAARSAGGFREPFALGEDLDLCIRLGEKGRLENLPDVLLKYRLHGQSVSVVFRERWNAYFELILQLAEERRVFGTDRLQRGERVELDLPPGDEDHGVVWHSRLARRALVSGRRATAWKHAFAAVRAQPTAGLGWRTMVRVALGAMTRE